MDKQDVDAQQTKYSNLGIKTTIIDKQMMKQRFPQINSDIGMFDNSGAIEWVPKEMDDETFFFYEDDAGYFEPVQALADLTNVLKTNYAQNVSLHFNSTVKQILHSSG